MVRLVAQLVIGVFLACSPTPARARPIDDKRLTLSRVEVIGTERLSSEDVAAGLHLNVGKEITRDELTRACARFNQLKLFYSAHCAYAISKNIASLSTAVKNDSYDLPVVFQNFVWLTRAELLKRLKQEIPLFMPELPEDNGLQSEIIRVLEAVAREHGIDNKVAYNAFWSIRGMYVFYVEGLSTPVVSLQIEGEDAPSFEEIQKWSKLLYSREDYSAPRLTWVIEWLVRDFYSTRGFIRPVVGTPRVECLTQKDGAYPVRVIVPISSGEVYKFGSVKFEGLAGPHATALLAKWKLDAGAPYDDSYVKHFVFEEILNQPWGMQSKNESRDVSVCSQPDETDKKVDVTIRVEPRKRLYHVVPGAKSCAYLGTINFPAAP